MNCPQRMALVKALVGRVVGLSDLAQASLAVGATSLLLPLLPHLSPATLGAVHLASASTHLGAHLYVGLVAGPTMFLNLPRHVFGDLQVRLNPSNIYLFYIFFLQKKIVIYLPL